MIVNFIKMQALGNDFVIIDNYDHDINLLPEWVIFICQRRLGVGCDQLILTEDIEPEKTVRISIYNADGSQAQACGNATRCVASQAMSKYQVSTIDVKTNNRTLKATLEGRLDSLSNLIKVNMGPASFDSSSIPLRGPSLDPMNLTFPELTTLAGENVVGHALSVGNPHLVVVVKDLSLIDVAKLGRELEHHPYFPERTNVEFIQVLDRAHIKMKVWERGSGITRACGTGATAAFAVARKLGLVEASNVALHLDGGNLTLSLNPQGDISLVGPATFVYEGHLKIDPKSILGTMKS